MKTVNIKRKFTFKVNNEMIILEDINPGLTPQEICSLLSNTYPVLTNASIENKGIIDDNNVYEFKTILGTKG